MTRLAGEKSPYLRHAARQPVDWHPWGDEAFDLALRQDRPIFLSTGAVWCHWCHVMAKECFEDPVIAALLNENFICIKLDRDERPEIDRRYQRAVAAMGNGSGWPLSVFLTPEGRPFFGGTYFPPDDSHGRPGFRKILLTVAQFYRTSRQEIGAYTQQLIDHLRPETPSGSLDISIGDSAEQAVLAEFDPQNGGFGTAPKFPMNGCLEFLMVRQLRSEGAEAALAVRKTLEAMAKGGFHDQLKGGFHRYSVDEAWIVPHFEKMADDNAWLLRNFVNGFALYGDPYFGEVARGIIGFILDVLSDPEGGFFASQDADVTPEDEGGYFTWTEEDFRTVLDDEEFRVLSLYLLHDRGAMHHDPAKRVLFIALEPEQAAARADLTLSETRRLIESGKEKLLAARDRRQAPFIDRTLYASLNGMLITSFLQAGRVLGLPEAEDFGLKSLQRIIALRLKDDGLSHTEGVKGLLEDYVHIVEALVAAYEATADASHLALADGLMQSCIRRFWDGSSGGFFDSEDAVMDLRLKGIEDLPHPSANSVAIMQLMKLFNMTGRDDYLDRAETALAAFSQDARNMGLHAAYYACCLDAYSSMVRVGVNAGPRSDLARASRETMLPYRSIVYGPDEGQVVPCINGVCLEPMKDAEKVRAFLTKPRLE